LSLRLLSRVVTTIGLNITSDIALDITFDFNGDTKCLKKKPIGIGFTIEE